MPSPVEYAHGVMVSAAAAWVAFMAGLVLGGQATDVVSFAIGGMLGVLFVGVGFAAASRARTLSPHATGVQQVRFAVFAIAIGAAAGLANLGANWLIAEIDPAIRTLLVRRFAALSVRTAVIAAPLIEEVAVRLFLMSVLAWIVWYFTRRQRLAFVVALILSSVVFASLHLARPLPLDTALANYYRAALMLKYTLAGLPLGWVFWRWGLPHAMLCHAASNAAHIAMEDVLF